MVTCLHPLGSVKLGSFIRNSCSDEVKNRSEKVCDAQNCCFAYEIYCLLNVFVAVAVVAEDANSWYTLRFFGGIFGSRAEVSFSCLLKRHE